MGILKHGGKVLSVGLLALSLSTGFSGLALARGNEGHLPRPAITATPNPVTLNRGEIRFTLQGSHLQRRTTYVINDTFRCRTDNIPHRITTDFNGQFSLRSDLNGCTPGRFSVTLNQGRNLVASTLVIVHH